MNGRARVDLEVHGTTTDALVVAIAKAMHGLLGLPPNFPLPYPDNAARHSLYEIVEMRISPNNTAKIPGEADLILDWKADAVLMLDGEQIPPRWRLDAMATQ